MQLIHGQKVGQHKIIDYIGTSVFGDVYSVIFGSTNRKYALHIIPQGSDITEEALKNYIKKLRNIQSPCIIKGFAVGESDGYRWIRTERPSGLKQAHLFTDINCQTPQEKEHKIVSDLDSLIKESASTGGLAVDDSVLVLYDVLETVSNLHAYDMYVGNPFSNPYLDKQLKPVGVVVKIPTIMWSVRDDVAEALKADVVEAGLLIEKVVNATNPSNRNFANAKADLLKIAEKAKNLEGYEAVCQLYLDVLEVFSKNSIKYYDRCSVEDFIFNPSKATSNEEEEETKEANEETQFSNRVAKVRKHKHKSAFSRQRRHSNKKHDTLNRQMVRNSKFVLILVLLVVFCGVLAYLLHKREQDQLISKSLTETTEYSAISIVGEDSVNVGVENLPTYVEDYSVEQLMTHKTNNPLVAARYSIMLWFGLEGVKQDREQAVALVEKNKSYYDEQYQYDVEIEYWRAYLMLVGVGYEPQRVEAEAILDKLANNGLPKAALMLGDLYAQKTTGDRKENDRRAMVYWRMAIRAEHGYKRECVLAMNRILHFINEDRGMPKEKEYEMLFNAVERFADRDHLPSVYLLARYNYEGRYIPQNYSNAVKWYRKIANGTHVHEVLRADAMVNLGTMFYKGEANQSNEAAYHWYERAAEFGDATAMQHLVELHEKNVPREFANEEERIKAGDAEFWKKQLYGVDIIEIKGISEPSYIIFNDDQMAKFKEQKPYPFTLRIHYAGSRPNPRTAELIDIFNVVRVVKTKR